MESATPVRGPLDHKITEKDVASATVTYIGKANPNAATSDPVWQIRRVTTTVGGNLSTRYADGNVEFDNIWDNRASLSY